VGPGSTGEAIIYLGEGEGTPLENKGEGKITRVYYIESKGKPYYSYTPRALYSIKRELSLEGKVKVTYLELTKKTLEELDLY
jgi:hypothetical protein